MTPPLTSSSHRGEALFHPLRQPRSPLAELGTLGLQVVGGFSQPRESIAAEADALVAHLHDLGKVGLLLVRLRLPRLRRWR